jgi:hypothetical protein
MAETPQPSASQDGRLLLLERENEMARIERYRHAQVLHLAQDLLRFGLKATITPLGCDENDQAIFRLEFGLLDQ